MKCTDSPLRKTMCATCPWRKGSPYSDLADGLTQNIMHQSYICHSTGSNNAINRRTGIRPHLCRGARKMQLKVLASLGIIEAPTDAAWNRRRVQQGMKPTITKDPI